MSLPDIRMATFIRAPSDRAYDALTQAEHLDSDCSTGWGEALTLLKLYVEHGVRY